MKKIILITFSLLVVVPSAFSINLWCIERDFNINGEMQKIQVSPGIKAKGFPYIYPPGSHCLSNCDVIKEAKLWSADKHLNFLSIQSKGPAATVRYKLCFNQ